VPGEDARLIHILSMFCISGVVFTGAINVLYNVFLITDNLKINSLFWLGVSVIDIIALIFVLEITDFGVYAVAAVSRLIGLVANIVFVPLYAAHCLKVRKGIFYATLFRYAGVTAFMTALFTVIKLMTPSVDNWFEFVVAGLAMAILGAAINILILFNKTERTLFARKIKARLKFR
jgi:hypothetical protein